MNKVIFSICALIVLYILSTDLVSTTFLKMLLQPEAFLIVVGGTVCATILNFDKQTLGIALKSALEIFKPQLQDADSIIKEIMQLSIFVRKKGLLALDSAAKEVQDPFLARGMQLVADIGNPQLIQDILGAEIAYEEEEELISSRVFEALGGYAPTFGLIGAVVGLIQVLKDFSSMDTLSIGIATAFVSTLYGVGLANVVFLPIAGNLKQKTREKIMFKELILQGILSISLQENPAILEEKLAGYVKSRGRNKV